MFSELNSFLVFSFAFVISAYMMGYIAKDVKSKNVFYKIILCIAFGLPTILAAFRTSGTDTFAYIHNYVSSAKIDWVELFEDVEGFSEIGHMFLTKFMSVFKSVRLYFGVYALLTLIPAYLAAQEIKKESVAWVMFIFLFGTFAESFNIMRQSFAVALVMLSFKYVFNRDFAKFMLIIGLATCFHMSAIVMIAVYFIWTKDDKMISWGLLALGLLAVVAVSVGLESVLEFLAKQDIESESLQRYTTYSTNEFEAQNREFYVQLLLTFVTVIHFSKLKKSDSKNSFFIYLMFIGTVLGACGFVSPYAKRVASYFTIANAFILPDIPKVYDDSKTVWTARVLLWVYVIGRFWLVYYILEQAHMIPYIWVMPSWVHFLY